MLIYFILLAVIFILGVILCRKKPSSAKKIIYISVVFVMFLGLSVFRYGIGNDYFNYTRIFMECYNTSGLDGIISLGYEPGFYLINKLIGLFTSDIVVVFAVYAVIILVPAAITIYRYSENIWLSCFAYVCFTFFYASMGFVRQSMAAAIVFMAYGLIRDRKHVAVIIVALVATVFHYTSLIFLVFYLLSLIKPTKKYLIIYGSVNITVYVAFVILKACGLNPMNLIAKAATAIFNRDFSSYINTDYFQTGLGFQYLIMPACVLAFVIISYFLGWKERKGADIMLNFMLLSASCWFFTTQVFIIERFSIFIFIFLVLVLPSITDFYLEKTRKSGKSKKTQIKRVSDAPVVNNEASENYYLIMGCVVAGSVIYNVFSAAMSFHGVFPYVTNIAPLQSSLISLSSQEEIDARLQTTSDMYEYLLLLKHSDNDVFISCSETNVDAINPVMISAMNELGISSERVMSCAGDYVVRIHDGVISEFTSEAVFDDLFGGQYTMEVKASPESGSILFEGENEIALMPTGFSIAVLDSYTGELIDAIGFDGASYGNACIKMQH